jgi:hypothetical protein
MRWSPGVSGEPLIHLSPKLGIAFALGVQEQTAGWLLVLQRLMKEILDPAPTVGIHDHIGAHGRPRRFESGSATTGMPTRCSSDENRASLRSESSIGSTLKCTAQG